ncbi:thioredoxin-disulfide reductase [Patescibacteria group bacterium]|nr:thioredoxin-disulfide reductase [Patescibacteria group bacterium]
MNKYDVIIIGSGPAGYSAAIYTTRAELKTLILLGAEVGGQLTTTTDVENYPGFPEGIMGPELMMKMKEQAERFGAETVSKTATNIEVKGEKDFIVKTEDESYAAKSIIIATGASAKWLGLESEQKLRGHGVSACATCDGFFFKGKTIAVVGAGDAAMEEANFLTTFATKVYLLVRKSKDEMKASKIMQERALNNPKIEFVFNTEVKEVLGENKVSGVRVINNKTKEEKEIELEGLFIAIGHKPNTDFLKDVVKLDSKGYLEITDNTKTSQEGIFAGGDVADYRYRQAITAAGTGCMASLDVINYLSK